MSAGRVKLGNLGTLCRFGSAAELWSAYGRPGINTRVMRLLTFSTLCVSVVLVGCSTHHVRLEYRAPAAATGGSRMLPAIAVGQFADDRGDDAQRGPNGTWIGAIRGGYGNSIKTVLLEQPVRDVVASALAQGLAARGALPDQNSGTYVLSGSVRTFACKQFVRRDCSVALDVVLSERANGRKVIEKNYEAYEFDGSLWALDAGVFGSVEKLRDLASRTLTAIVDKVLDDDALIEAALQPRMLGLKEQSRQAEGRLRELKILLDQGLISQQEYEIKRAAVLNDL